MVKLRLKRQGRKKRPFYRVVVIAQQARRDGAPIAELGYYDPLAKTLKLNKAEALAWLAKGAQPSETVARLITLASEDGSVVQLPKKEKKEHAAPAPAVEVKAEKPAKEAAPEAVAEPVAVEATEEEAASA
jgi:small subunit ribosomal protein S16